MRTLILLAGSALALTACDRAPAAPEVDNDTTVSNNIDNATADDCANAKRCNEAPAT